MKQSELFTKAQRTFPSDEEAEGIRFLVRAGFVNKEMAGVYSFLPLGLRVMRKIEKIIREEMEAVGGREILMPVLHPRENWEKTGRWKNLDVLFKVEGRDGRELALGPTHEEIVVPLAKKFISSYRDLPVYVFQIQDKMRDEPRAKSGLLRGREFWMKDFYSFHASEADLDKFYAKMAKVYTETFRRMGLLALTVRASGGTFSKYSHEFQVLSAVGEDTIFYCSRCQLAENKEISGLKQGGACPECRGKIREEKAIEVGNIFKLGTKYAEPFQLRFKDRAGKEKTVVMGCYGIGISRAMGAVAEVYHDPKGLIWPEGVVPFQVHLLELEGASGKKICEDLQKAGIEVLYDDRKISAGEKFAEADLMGIPWRLVVSKKTGDKVEVKKRGEDGVRLMGVKEVLQKLKM